MYLSPAGSRSTLFNILNTCIQSILFGSLPALRYSEVETGLKYRNLSECSRCSSSDTAAIRVTIVEPCRINCPPIRRVSAVSPVHSNLP